METFETIDELWLDAARQIHEDGHDVGSRDGETREILGYTARLENPRANFMFNPLRKLSASYAAAEVLWYLSGEDRIDRIVAYAPQYERFAEDGIAHGAYGHRWGMELFMNSQMHHLCILLKEKQESRQAVVTMWDQGDLVCACVGKKKDLPCTLALNFIVREGKLNLVATMRSNDIWLGLPYDIYAFTCIQQLIASHLKLELGWYQHQATSLHVYKRNQEKFDAARTPKSFTTGALDYVPGESQLWENISHALRYEKWNREKRCCTKGMNSLDNTLLGQHVIMASSKFADFEQVKKRINNKLMKEHIQRCLS